MMLNTQFTPAYVPSNATWSSSSRTGGYAQGETPASNSNSWRGTTTWQAPGSSDSSFLNFRPGQMSKRTTVASYDFNQGGRFQSEASSNSLTFTPEQVELARGRSGGGPLNIADLLNVKAESEYNGKAPYEYDRYGHKHEVERFKLPNGQEVKHVKPIAV